MFEYPRLPFRRVDIFCRVVDNFGDIGVCWRLARQLQQQYGLQIRLWIDRPEILGALLREYDYSSNHCFIDGIEVCAWSLCAPATEPAEVVIEAFACEIPDFYQQAMAECSPPPLWINLEYLSAEGWVESCHGLPSRHPRLPLQKHFFFPGFTPATGGLLREDGLEARRQAFLGDAVGMAAWLAARGVRHEPAGALSVSLFAYEQPALAALLPVWQGSARPIALRVPEGRVLTSLAGVLGRPFVAGDCLRYGALTVNVLPFMSQDDYDRLLWSCDLNCVRGEDSFVRAQWAQRPLLWHIYPQHEDAHQLKLEAFLERYCAGLAAADGSVLREAWRAWNACGSAPEAMAAAWPRLLEALPRLQGHAESWAAGLQGQAGLAAALVQFCKSKVK